MEANLPHILPHFTPLTPLTLPTPFIPPFRRSIVIDEGHRLKNSECKLSAELKCYTSSSRLLLTGGSVGRGKRQGVGGGREGGGGAELKCYTSDRRMLLTCGGWGGMERGIAPTRLHYITNDSPSLPFPPLPSPPLRHAPAEQTGRALVPPQLPHAGPL